MAIAPIGSTPDIAATAASSLKLDDLLQVLLTELTHQDPFKPVDNKDFMAQIAQFASLDASQQLNGNIEQLLLVQAINQSVGLMGRTVSATLDDGSTVNGVVDSVSLANGVPRLTIHTTDGTDRTIPNISIGQLETIRDPVSAQ
jgi:flagellar basal-body rod modification protein FlgD